MLIKSSKYHYRFCPSGRELLLIGNSVYEAPLSNGFDPDGIRYGAMRIMSLKEWEAFDANYEIRDTTIYLTGKVNGGWRDANQAI